MHKIPIVIFGASGHAKVIVDIIESGNTYYILGFIDNEKPIETRVLGYKVLGDDSSLLSLIDLYRFNAGVIAIGDNFVRSRVAKHISKISKRFQFVNCIHPSAHVSKHCYMGRGNVIMAGATINPATQIADHCIVNTNSSLDHDCLLDNFSCLAPQSVVGGSVKVGEFSFIGIGATVLNNIEIARNCIIGGGSVVTRNTVADSIYIGNPAKFAASHDLGEGYL